MNIVFISPSQYPDSGAASNRHLAYAKGLVELGHSVEFVLLNKQTWEDNILIENGIFFIPLFHGEGIHTSKIKKATILFESIKKAKSIITSKNSTNKIDALILLGTDIITIIPLLHLANKLNIKTFHERTEYPFAVGRKSSFRNFKLFIYLNFVLKKFDGLYVINRALRDYFKQQTKGKVAIEIVNMIVDPTRFECSQIKERSEIVIGYCGTLDGDKDGVPILIEAFSLLIKKIPKARLQLIGSLDNEVTKQKISSIINRLSLEESVELTGRIKRNDIPEYLCNADILALARPANIQAEGGFPTKLGEYLATGNPVVVTKVGEIDFFLTDKINAFLSAPDSPLAFATKLEEAILSKEKKIIGMEGKKLVFKEFNYLTQARVLEKFFIDA